MSCSMQAAHSSSRSSAPRSCRPASPSWSNICSDSRRHVLHVLVVGAEAVREVGHGLAADVLEQGGVAVLQQPLEEDPLAQAGLGHLHLGEAAVLHRRGHHHRAAQDHVAAVGLDAADRAALGRRAGGQLLDQLLEGVAREHEALHVQVGQLEALLDGGGQVADGAAEAAPAAAPRRPATTRTPTACGPRACAAPSAAWRWPPRRAGRPRSPARRRAAPTRPRPAGGRRSA